jgi:uncharacterized protein YbjT (DUF2867 family)
VSAPAVLVTSAAGMTGLLVVRALSRRGAAVRALVRGEAQAAAARAAGAAGTLIGDLRTPEHLARACEGVHAVYHICPRLAPDEVAIGTAAIAAARAARVPRFVYHGVAHPYVQAMPHHWDKLQVQLALEQSDLAYAVIQPTNYMQNITWAWQALLETGTYFLPYSAATSLTWVDAEEVAEAAARVVLEPGFEGGAYELCGTPRALTRHEICQALSRRLGRTIRAGVKPWDEWRQIPRYRGWSEEQLRRLRLMFEYYDRHGFRAGNPKVLEMILGRGATGYEAFLERLAATAAH